MRARKHPRKPWFGWSSQGGHLATYLGNRLEQPPRSADTATVGQLRSDYRVMYQQVGYVTETIVNSSQAGYM